MQELKYIEFSKKIKEIKEKFEIKVQSIQDISCKYIYEDYLKDMELKRKDKLYIALIGQYSSGKSSIVSALTKNQDIGIGQNVTTDKASEYEWNDIILVDTPGIGTQNMEHDSIAYRYMDLADLLIYVVTVQGFDAIIANDFRKIAFEQNKASKMMLVVNKTSLEPFENKSNWENHIKTVIEPLELETLKVTFIDARDYLDSLNEMDIEDKKELEICSNFEEFIKNINEFITEKKIIGKLVSELNIIEKYLSNILDKITMNEDTIKIIELISRKKRIIENSRDKINKEIDYEIDSLCIKIIDISNKLIDKLSIEMNKTEIKIDFEDANYDIERESNECIKQIETIINEELDKLIKQLNELKETPLYDEILIEFEDSGKNIDFNIKYKEKRDMAKIKKLPDAVTNIAKFLDIGGSGFKDWCINAQNVEKGLKAVSGSDAHKFVLDIGHFFGKKFKPYEAIKIANKIGKAGEVISKVGKGIGIVGAVASPMIAIYDEYQENKCEESLKKARQETKQNFRIFANETKKYFMNKKNEIIENIYDKELANIKRDVKKLRDEEKLNSKNAAYLLEIEKEITSLSERMSDNK